MVFIGGNFESRSAVLSVSLSVCKTEYIFICLIGMGRGFTLQRFYYRAVK